MAKWTVLAVFLPSLLSLFRGHLLYVHILDPIHNNQTYKARIREGKNYLSRNDWSYGSDNEKIGIARMEDEA